MKLTQRLLLALLCMGVLPAAMVGWVAIGSSVEAINRQSETHLRSHMSVKKHQLEAYFSELKLDMTIFAETLAVLYRQLGDLRQVQTLLQRSNDGSLGYLQRYTSGYRYDDLLLFDASGNMLFSASQDRGDSVEPLSVQQRADLAELFRRVVASGSYETLDFSNAGSSDRRYLAYVAVPVFSGRELISVVALGLSLNRIHEILRLQVGVKEPVISYLVNSAGNVLSHSQGRAAAAINRLATRSALAGETGLKTVRNDGRGEFLSAYTPISFAQNNLALIVEVARQQIYQPMLALVRKVVLLAILLCAVVLVLAFTMARRISRPLGGDPEDLKQLAADIAHGQFELSAHGDVDRDTIYASIVDMASRLQVSERQLLEERSMLKEVLSHIDDAVLAWDHTGQLSVHNRSAQRYLQSSDAGAITLPVALQLLRERLHRGVMIDAETVDLDIRGVRYKLIVDGLPLRTEDGTQIGSMLSMHDITERDAYERELRQSEERFRRVFESVAIGMQVCDMRGAVVMCNLAFKRMLGLEQVSDQEIDILAITHPDDRARTVEVMNTLFGGLREVKQLEKRYLHRDGHVVWARIVASPLYMDGVSPCYALVTVEDISAWRSAEVERERLQRRLQQAEKMEAIGQLTGGIAHDFNNMLASIMGYADLALMKYDDELNEKLKHYLREIFRAGTRARDLIAQMMVFSRTDAGQAGPLALVPAVKEILTMLRATFPATIEIDASYDQDLPPVLMDLVKMHQVLINLMVNARDAINGVGRIRVSIARRHIHELECVSCHEIFAGEYIELVVEDSGSGIDMESVSRLFDPFYTTKDVGKGTGMGLSVVHGVVHEFGGHIGVDSPQGRGAVFRIFLALAQDEQVQPLPALEQGFALGHGNGRIMVVDDEPLVAEYLSELFEASGYQVSCYTDSREALGAFERQPDAFDLVISDQTMPQMAGLDLARAMLALRPALPVVLSSGLSEHVEKQQLVDAGVEHFLKKPIRPNELLGLVQQLLIHSRN